MILPEVPSGRAEICFKRLSRADFGLIRSWLDEPLVRRWWNHDSSVAAVERDFGPSVDGADAAEFFVVSAGTRPFGLIQRYPLAAYPEYLQELATVVQVAPDAASIDYLIGEPAYRGRGWGAAMIRGFVGQLWAALPDAAQVVVPVAAGNRASWRALERAGFTRLAEGDLAPDNPVDPRDHFVYAMTRPGVT